MTQTLLQTDCFPLILHLRPVIKLTDDQLFKLCGLNKELRIERTAEGDLLIMPPAGAETGKRDADLTIAFGVWAKQDGSGVIFGSSTGFFLPNGAMRSPDVAWVERSRLAPLTPDQKKKFLPLCPDFVLELRSPSDRVRTLQAKMREYIENGAQLGWLLVPEDRRVYVYRPGRPVERLDDPAEISGDPVLPGFVLHLADIWEPGL